MILSSASSHSIIPIDESDEAPTSTATGTEEHEPAPPSVPAARPLKHRSNHRSTPAFSSISENPSKNHELRTLGTSITRRMTIRERAEIQLQGLLSDPEASLPAFARQITDNLPDENISIEQVSKLLNTQAFVIDRIVRAIYPSKNNDGAVKTLSKIEVQNLTRILNGTMDVRTLVFFLMLNIDDDQYITYNELAQFYEQYLKALKTFDGSRMNEFIHVLSKKFHLDHKPRIDFDEFYSIVSKDQTLLESLSQFTVNPNWFVKTPTEKPQKSRLDKFFSRLCWQQSMYEQHKNKLTLDYIKDNLPRISFITLYILVNLALMLYVIIYRSVVTKSHVLVVFARTAGMLLNFNCALIYALMLKRSILVIRTIKILRNIVPVDDHIDFHKVVGRTIGVLSIIHTIAHMANFGRLTDYSWGAYMFTTKPNIGWVGGFAPLSGVLLCIILAVMVICSMQWIRRGGYFQIFYWTHLLYFPFFILLIIHARNYWKWAIGPLVILLLEKIYSLLTRFSSSGGRTYLKSATIEQSNVISLKIHRPKNFSFKPGDYITINLPRVALYEFHPFTISSAPEETNYVTVHIQAVGNWTKRVYQRFKDMSEAENGESHVRVYRADLNRERSRGFYNEEEQEDVPHQLESDSECGSTLSRSSSMTRSRASSISRTRTKVEKKEPVVINGPYSSCARYVFDCKHVVLIGGGIGVTPYASILSSLMAQFRASRIICKHCQGVNYHSRGLGGNRRLRKVDFIWVNRDQKNFEWFLNLLRQFEQEQEYYLTCNADERRFLDIHLYFTEIRHEENIGNAPLDLVTRVWAEVAGQDIFTNLKSKTHIGRPNWDELFDRLISGENASMANDVNVFFCGPKTMGNTIREHCSAYRFRFYEENF